MEIVSMRRLTRNCGDIARDMIAKDKEALCFRTDGQTASFPDIAAQQTYGKRNESTSSLLRDCKDNYRFA